MQDGVVSSSPRERFLPLERPRETLVVRERKATGLRATVKADMFSWSGVAEGAGRCAAQGMSSRDKFQWKSSGRRRGLL